MSSEESKAKRSLRRLRNASAVKKQVKIAKSAGIPIDEPHMFAKHHAMDCGNPGCSVCSNPRTRLGERTIQEKRFYQDLDSINDKHSNGLAVQE